MTTFYKRKQDVLSKIDKSKKGSIDKDIKELVDLVNSLPDYYTTSSCSGRIFLLEVPDSKKKNEMEWLFVRHDPVTFDEIRTALSSMPKKNIWFKQESMIIHICCRDIDAADTMLTFCHDAGLKRAGIINLGKRIIVEAFGTERLDTIVAEKGNILVTDEYLRQLVVEANNKHALNLKRIEKLYSKFKELKEKNKN
jgi:tRNA wybutosine-synthesizing protein 3